VKTLVTAAEASRLDQAVSSGWRIAPGLLMEKASLGIWNLLEPLLPGLEYPPEAPLVALAGPGNNGGDALAVLRHARFTGRKALAAVLLEGRESGLCALQRESLESMGVEILHWPQDRSRAIDLLSRASVLVDGIAGTGLKGALREEAADLVAAANASRRPIMAVDVPSGLSDGFDEGFPVIKAAWTASVEPRKACLYYPAAREASGVILAVENVFPPDSGEPGQASLLESTDLLCLLPRVSPSAHKGSRGRLGLFAGSLGMTGAASLAAAGARAAAVGLVNLFADSDLYPELASGRGPESLLTAIVRPLPESLTVSDLASCDALLAGPGWGRAADRESLLSSLLASGVPLVIDADGLRIASRLFGRGQRPVGPAILTPHPGEFEDLSGLPAGKALANPAAVLPKVAADLGSVVVLKSHVTWIASPDGRLALWEGLEPSLATAGSGDVLAGLAAGFLASMARTGAAAAGARAAAPAGLPRGAPAGPDGGDLAWRAALAAVIAHGLAGRSAARNKGWYGAEAIAEEAALMLR
jgi:NAD(P)H-hydrate epimerase